ncbi:MAG: OmpA family protein [Chitinivibrionales bacterium]|nr:OmpA family protein [Chitinivibrionales bacterium]
MNRLLIGLLLIFMHLHRSVAENASPWDEKPGAASIAARPSSSTFETLQQMQDVLDKEFKSIAPVAPAHETDLYLEASARIEASRDIVAKKPDSKEGRGHFCACSLLTHAALVQFAVTANESRIESLHNERTRILSDLNAIQEKIIENERSAASQLKAELDSEKEKMQKLQEEANKKFGELQSALIQVSQDARGTIISMSDILFDIGKATLTSDLKTSLAKIAGILLVFKNSKVIIEGHTDNQGAEEFNQKLSENRAANVMEFLVEQGVSASRLKAVGYAFHRPIADNDTREGRQKNRRVDLVVQEQKKITGQ